MRKCTLRYVWMGTSYKSELTIMNTAAFLPMIRHLNKCSCCVFWNMRSHGEERIAVAWGCQQGIKNIGKNKEQTWKLDINFSCGTIQTGHPLPSSPRLIFLWVNYLQICIGNACMLPFLSHQTTCSESTEKELCLQHQNIVQFSNW